MNNNKEALKKNNQLKAGDNKIRFSSHNNVDIKIDYFKLEPIIK